MIRKIIKINEEKCNGCGACAAACHEGAIIMSGGKAKLVRDDYCDGLGDCLPACPMNAISFEEREASAYNPEVVSKLCQWPVQIKLLPVNAPYFHRAHLLIAADCTAYAYAKFHEDFMKNKVTLVGCPKLDAVDYSEKLAEIFKENDIQDITVVRMEVPCCGGMEYAVKKALDISKKQLSWNVVTINIRGNILETRAFH